MAARKRRENPWRRGAGDVGRRRRRERSESEAKKRDERELYGGRWNAPETPTFVEVALRHPQVSPFHSDTLLKSLTDGNMLTLKDPLIKDSRL